MGYEWLSSCIGGELFILVKIMRLIKELLNIIKSKDQEAVFNPEEN